MTVEVDGRNLYKNPSLIVLQYYLINSLPESYIIDYSAKLPILIRKYGVIIAEYVERQNLLIYNYIRNIVITLSY